MAWLVKFAGLGEAGTRKFRMAQQLHEAGFTPEAAGYRHGFLVERWDEEPDGLDQACMDRKSLSDQVGAYLGFRARHFTAAEYQGASLDELRHMALYNIGQALGAAATSALESVLADPGTLEGKVRRVWTDNRMHVWEWLVSGDKLVKTDALDHSAAHDLVGCQDVTWDIAGAIIELDLSDEEASRLCEIVRQESGHPVYPDLTAFMLPCYLAFQMGSCLMAAGALGEGQEAARLRQDAERYAHSLQKRLSRRSHRSGSSQEQAEAQAS
jgi:hypothetical protein